MYTPLTQANQYNTDLAAGEWVYCPMTEDIERTADGFCQSCGSTSHASEPVRATQRAAY